LRGSVDQQGKCKVCGYHRRRSLFDGGKVATAM
jgi:hypothetical protein